MPRRSTRTKKKVIKIAKHAQVDERDADDVPDYKHKKPGQKDYIVTIDRDFDGLDTGYKTMAGLKEFDRRQVSTWYNKFRSELGLTNKQNILWLEDHWPKIEAYIEQQSASKKYSPNTVRIHYMSLAHALLAIDKNRYRELTRPWWLEGLKIAIDEETKRQNNQLTEDEEKNFVCYTEIERRQKEVYALWLSDKNNLVKHMDMLVLSLNTLMPPLRKTLLDMVVWRQKSKNPPKNNTNYIWEQHAGKWSIVVNYDKIENNRRRKAEKKGVEVTRDVFRLDEELPGLKGKGKLLNEIIIESLRVLPREYLLVAPRKPKTAMGGTSYDAVFKKHFHPKFPRQTIVRKSFVNHFYRLGLSWNDLEVLAHRMRHTVSVAQKAYFKLNVNCEETIGSKSTSFDPLPPPRPIAKRPKPKDPRVTQKEYRSKPENKAKIKEWRQKNKDRISGTKYLWLLKNGFVSNPRQSTLDKYGISYDENIKNYVKKTK